MIYTFAVCFMVGNNNVQNIENVDTLLKKTSQHEHCKQRHIIFTKNKMKVTMI